MLMDKVASSGNDEFYTPRYAVAPLLKHLPAGFQIWCPFDTYDSLIVRSFQERGDEVTATHISSGVDFFSAAPPPHDFIVSNPPYSRKADVFERLFSLRSPFAMLVGVVGLFESQRRFDIFSQNTFEIMYLNKRVSYFKDYADEKPSINPPFSSVWLCHKILPRPIVFERVEKT